MGVLSNCPLITRGRQKSLGMHNEGTIPLSEEPDLSGLIYKSYGESGAWAHPVKVLML